MAIIEIKNLTYQYALAAHPSQHNISLKVAAGDFIVLAGQSGSGKTTLLTQLKPELWPAGQRSGEILFDGQPISAATPTVSAQRIGMVFQNPDDQLVMDNVISELAFSLENVGVKSADCQKRIAEMVSFLGMQDLLYESVQHLSGGQKQLVNLAAVLILQPQVLLLDEPTAQLDPIATKDFVDLLARVHDELGMTVIMSEHHLDDALPLANRLWVIDDGRLIHDGTVQDGLKQLWAVPKLKQFVPDVPYVYLNNGFADRQLATALPLTVAAGRKLSRQPAFQFAEQAIFQTPPGPKAVLQVNHATFEYEKNGVAILDDLNLTVHENEWLAVIGKNGTGKTTLLKTLMGLLPLRRGRISILGKKLVKWHQVDLFSQVGYLAQDPGNYFSYDSVREELVQRANQLGLANPEDAAEKMLAELALTKIADQNPHDTSGGQQQLIALGIVLMANPRILLLDEPTKGLDPLRRLKLGQLLARLRDERGLVIIMASHDMSFSARFANQCALLFDGQIVAKDEPHQFFASNFFYTTAVNRMLRGQLPKIINREEAVNHGTGS